MSPETLNFNKATGLSSLSGSIVAGTLNATLAASLGVKPNTLGGTETSSAFNIVFNGNTGTGFATTNSVQLASATPEPGSMFLLGFGMIGLSVLTQKRFTR